MPNVRTWTLKIRGDEKDAVRAADKVERRYKGMGDGINRKLSDSLGKTESRFSRFRTRVSATGARTAAVFGGALVAGVVALGAGIASTFKAAQESLKVGKQTANVIKTMGANSWTSVKQVGALATRLSNMTGIDDELIQQGANLVLTFRNIRNEAGRGNDIFDRTVAVANDMSVALGTDMKKSSIQLGKALNDPVKGITALQRVGVSFTQGQRDQIKALVESGNTLQAQKLILKEVEAQFGGTAAAVATPWDKLKVTLGNVAEELGAKLFPMANKVAEWFGEKIPAALDTAERLWAAFTAGFRNPELESGRGIFRIAQEIGQAAAQAWPHIQTIGRVIGDVAGKIRDFFRENPAVAFTVLGTVLGGVVLSAVVGLAAAVGALISPFVLVVAAVAAVAGAAVYAYTRWEGFRNVVNTVVIWFRETAIPAMRTAVEFLREKFVQFVAWFQQSALPAIRRVIDFVVQKFNELKAWDGWAKIRTIITVAVTVIAAVIGAFVITVMALWDRFGATILTYVRSVWNAIWRVISGALQVIKGVIDFWLSVFTGDWAGAWEAIQSIVGGFLQIIRGLIELGLAQIRYVISLAWQTILAVTGAIWNAILAVLRGIWEAIWGVITGVVNTIVGFFREHWRIVLGIFTLGLSELIGFVVTKWDTIKTTVSEAIGWIRRKIEGVLGTISEIWNRIWGGMGGAVSIIFETIKSAVRTGVNKVIDVINWFIRLINNIPGVNIDELGHVGGGGDGGRARRRARTGRQEHARGRARGGFMTNTGGRGAEYVVGEGNRWHREAVIATDPRYRKRNRGLVAWAAQKLGMGAPGFAIGGIPNPVEGVGDAIGGGVRAVGGAIRGAADRARDFMQDLSARALGPVRDAAKAMIDRLPGGERIQFLRDFGKNVVDRVYRWAAGKAEEGQKAMGGPGSNVGYRGGGGVERWRSTALQALRMTGSPASWIGSLLRRMNQESGGNPNAINNWDINAQRGDPSGGLMQNIRSAYASRVSGFPSLRGTNFLHPLGSIVASIVYANRRYGSAPRGWDRPGGYRNGGVVNVPGPTHPGEMVLRRGDQRQLLKLVRGRGPGGAEPRTVIHVGKLVVGGDTPGEVRRNAHIFMDVIEQRQIEHDARSA